MGSFSKRRVKNTDEKKLLEKISTKHKTFNVFSRQNLSFGGADEDEVHVKPQESKYTVTLADDPSVAVLTSALTLLDSRFFSSTDALLQAAPSLSPVAVFVDIHPGNTYAGLDFIPKLRASWPFSAILVMTVLPDPELVGRALAVGANDFVSKPLAQLELRERLQARLCEMSLKSRSEFIEMGCGRFNARKRYLEGPGGTIYLSPLQAELLQVLVEKEGLLVTKSALKKAIWGKITVSDNALDRRLSEMRKILKDAACEMHIVSEYGKGISLQHCGPVVSRRFSA